MFYLPPKLKLLEPEPLDLNKLPPNIEELRLDFFAESDRLPEFPNPPERTVLRLFTWNFFCVAVGLAKLRLIPRFAI